MDKEFMSYCLNLPLGMRRKNGFNRYVMREAMKDLIPNEIITRVTKSNVGEYYNYSLRDNFTSMKECIHSAPHCLRQYLDIDRLEQMSSFVLTCLYQDTVLNNEVHCGYILS